MNFELIKLPELSGRQTSVYTVTLQGEKETLFEAFIRENMASNKKEVLDILDRLQTMGKEIGFREHFFKLNEGLPGDMVCALYDNPKSKLRLFCIRFAKATIILGGGGPKPKHIRRWQDDPILKEHAEEMIHISAAIYQRMKDGEIEWNDDKLDGALQFFGEEHE